jgi:MFS family permease
MNTLRLARTRAPFAGLQLASIFFSLGNAITAIVYPWLVYDLTGSASWMGIVAFVTLAPAILGSAFGGPVAERLGIRQTAMIAVGLGCAASIAAALLYGFGMMTIGALVALALLGAIFDGPGSVAIESRVPEIARLARMPLLRANAIDDLVDNGAAIVGPAIAALLVAIVETSTLLWIIAALNIVTALMTALSLPQFRLRQMSSTASTELAGAMRIIFGSLRLRTALLLASLGTGTFVALENVALPAILRAEGQSASTLGLYLTAAAAGAHSGQPCNGRNRRSARLAQCLRCRLRRPGRRRHHARDRPRGAHADCIRCSSRHRRRPALACFHHPVADQCAEEPARPCHRRIDRNDPRHGPACRSRCRCRAGSVRPDSCSIGMRGHACRLRGHRRARPRSGRS